MTCRVEAQSTRRNNPEGARLMSVTCQIKNYNLLQKQLEQMKKAPATVLKRTVSDMQTRVPKWVAAEVSKAYGVKKAEINNNKIGKVKVEGNTVSTVKIKYTGRVLTPTHFGMSPTVPGQNAYTLKATIIKGQRATLGKVKKLTKKQRAALGKNFTKSGTRNSDHSPIMLMRTGTNNPDKTPYIPFQRKSTRRSDVEAIKTLSLPQMVSSERTAPNITKAINEGLGKRLEQHMKLMEK